ncbi:MAG: TfoX/Sxy family protein [Cyanobacteria bacterium P01_A01_bin.37]
MPSRSAYVDTIVQHLNQVAPVTARAMFGGYGLYAEGVMFALIAYDTLYFKVDDGNRQQYLDMGSEPFTYTGKGKPIQMSYYRLPENVSEDLEQLEIWVAASRYAARRSKAKSKPRKKKTSGTQ